MELKQHPQAIWHILVRLILLCTFSVTQINQAAFADSPTNRQTLLQAAEITYSREYYLSHCKKYRITKDSNLDYYKISNSNNLFIGKQTDKNSIILELKYHEKDYKLAKNLSNHIPFRITKSSKYVNGIQKIFSNIIKE